MPEVTSRFQSSTIHPMIVPMGSRNETATKTIVKINLLSSAPGSSADMTTIVFRAVRPMLKADAKVARTLAGFPSIRPHVFISSIADLGSMHLLVFALRVLDDSTS